MNTTVDDMLQYSDLDRRIWAEELEEFVPQRLFDAHVHLWNDAFATPATPRPNDWRDHNTDLADQRRIGEILFPGRELHYLAFPVPVKSADYDRLTPWLIQELSADPQSYGAMLVVPEMSGQYVADTIRRHPGLVGLKPYYALTGKPRPDITDYLPEAQMEVADEHRLAVILHLPDGPERSLPELEHFVAQYPRIRWILAHCAASGNPFQLERVIGRLRDLPNLWYDTSGNNELYTLMLLLKYENRQRILFATDSALVMGGCRRSKAVSYAYATHFLHLENATFRVYEQLRTMRHACRLFELLPAEIDDFFYHNARMLLEQLRQQPVRENMEPWK